MLLLRLAVGVAAVGYGLALLPGPREHTALGWILGLSAIGSGLLLLAGLFTPMISSVVCFGAIGIAGFSWISLHDPSVLMWPLYTAVIAAGLALLGPGTYSVDARMFGRREIIIPRAKSSPKDLIR